MAKQKRPAVVHILWLDSVHTSGWRQVGGLSIKKHYLKHETIGFLLKETEFSYSVVQSMRFDRKGHDSTVDAIMEIPKATIIRYREYIPGAEITNALPAIMDGAK